MDMNGIDWGETFQRAGDLVQREIAGETLLVPIRGNLADMERIFSLSPVGAFVWERIDGRTPLSAICDQVLEAFSVDLGTARADIADFVGQLRSARLIESGG